MNRGLAGTLCVVGLFLSCAAPSRATAPAQDVAGARRSSSYSELVALFADWRAFQKPKVVEGVPDYTSAAMAAQARELASYRQRLEAIDPRGWPIPEQVDYHLLRAELNGLDFDHRVLRPWARNPAFYVTVAGEETDQPAREGPLALGTVELWTARFPLDAAGAAALTAGLAPLPALLQQARLNLTGDARDLWVYGIRSLKEQGALLEELLPKTQAHPALAEAARRALDANQSFVSWLEQQAPGKTGPSGIGVANYDWYLANVQLLPYTWADERALVERELARARAGLAIEEEKNRKLPPQPPVASAAEHQRRFGEGVTEYMAFLAREDVLTIRPDMDPALRTHVGHYNEKRPLEFFTEVDYRDPVLLRTHGYHWFDLARMEHDPHPSPLRRGALLYNLFDSRTEGFATAMEELMMHRGLVDARPRSRELVYILLAQRGARALGDLRMQSNELSLEQAARFAAANTPRGWLRLEGGTVWGEQHLYLQQPGYGTSYVVGKVEFDKLIAARAQQLGASFTLKQVLDEMNGAGLIPVSLLRWQMTGKSDEVPGDGWPRPRQ